MQHASAVLLSFNRLSALRRTLTNLRAIPQLAEVIVVDNASTDGTQSALEREFPWVRLIALPHNLGVQGFNVGVTHSSHPVVVILDDDSWPDHPHPDAPPPDVPHPNTISLALQTLTTNPSLGGVALLPRHPSKPGHPSEWPFAHHPDSTFPVFGCGNVVRRAAWDQVGGYERDFFLYRNDADLALKLLGAGWGVAFNPNWVVWHDSPAAAVKGERWLHLATRNYLWLCRRHGEGTLTALLAITLCAAWSLAQATKDPANLPTRIRATLRGIRDGIVQPPPHLHTPPSPDGLRKLLQLQLLSRFTNKGETP